MESRRILEVRTTVGDLEEAAELIRRLVKKRLAACGQIMGPIRSIYRWQGRMEDENEWLCLLKTTADCYPALEQEILQHHPYETPEILAVPVEFAAADYVEWLHTVVRSAAGE